MKISELQDYIKELHFKDYLDVDVLIMRLIYDDKIKSFMPLLSAYIQKQEKDKEYTKCELIESASLLHLRRLGIDMPNQDNREYHVINKHSSLSCKDDLSDDYDYDREEANFRKTYNIERR